MKTHQQNHLKIIFITDIHLQFPYLNSLKKWIIQYTNSNSKFDICLIGGDTANCENTKELNQSQQQAQLIETYKVYDTIIEITNCPLIYVPGNHDPLIFFQQNQTFRKYENNIHRKRFQIAQNLDIVGMGGSGPAFMNGEEVWQGYPYKSDEDLKKECELVDLLGKIEENCSKQIIMFTHVGPDHSSTTIDRRQLTKQNPIKSGSKYFNSFLDRKDILIWLHGHTHHGGASDRINGIQIINPGPLVYGRFMVMELEREGKGKWMLRRKTFEQLEFE